MNKLNIYKWSTWGLLLLNIAMITGFFLTRPQHPKDAPLQQSAKAEMNLTDDQNKLFLQSVEKHRAQTRQLDDAQMQLLQLYFSTLTSNEATNRDSLIIQFQDIEKQKITGTYEHFSEIKSMLKPEQYNSYNAFLQKALGRIFKKGKKRLPPPKD
jgi:hypothetical protein